MNTAVAVNASNVIPPSCPPFGTSPSTHSGIENQSTPPV